MTSGPQGELQEAFERGLRFLATALALHEDHRSDAATVSAACDAIRCLMVILEAARLARDTAAGLLPRLG